MSDELPVLDDWYRFLGWLLDTTAKFPKSARFSFAVRIDNLALDVLEGILEARYSPRREKRPILQRINLHLEKLRLLLRLSYDRKFIGLRGYEHSAKELAAVGKQIGGWYKGVAER